MKSSVCYSLSTSAITPSDELKKLCLSFDSRYFCTDDLKNASNSNDVIKEFRNVFLERYLEKNKVGRKTKQTSKLKLKSSVSLCSVLSGPKDNLKDNKKENSANIRNNKISRKHSLGTSVKNVYDSMDLSDCIEISNKDSISPNIEEKAHKFLEKSVSMVENNYIDDFIFNEDPVSQVEDNSSQFIFNEIEFEKLINQLKSQQQEIKTINDDKFLNSNLKFSESCPIPNEKNRNFDLHKNDSLIKNFFYENNHANKVNFDYQSTYLENQFSDNKNLYDNSKNFVMYTDYSTADNYSLNTNIREPFCNYSQYMNSKDINLSRNYWNSFTTSNNMFESLKSNKLDNEEIKLFNFDNESQFNILNWILIFLLIDLFFKDQIENNIFEEFQSNEFSEFYDYLR